MEDCILRFNKVPGNDILGITNNQAPEIYILSNPS